MFSYLAAIHLPQIMWPEYNIYMIHLVGNHVWALCNYTASNLRI